MEHSVGHGPCSRAFAGGARPAERAFEEVPMTQILEGTLQSIGDVKVNYLVKRALNVARLAAHRAIAHADDPARYPIPASPDSLEQIILKRFRTRKPGAMARATARTKAFLALDATARTRKMHE